MPSLEKHTNWGKLSTGGEKYTELERRTQSKENAAGKKKKKANIVNCLEWEDQ